MGDIGPARRTYEVLPLREPAPVPEPAPPQADRPRDKWYLRLLARR